MDFSFTPEQDALRELARKIFTDTATHDKLKRIEAEPDWFAREAWGELAKANLLGLAVAEEHGGSGLGLVELALLLEEVGRHVVPVPVYASLLLGALTISDFGTPEQKAALLPGVVSGQSILTAAIHEALSDEPGRPATRARRDGAGWRLDGAKTCVPAAHLASRILVPASIDDGRIGIFLVDPRASGVRLETQTATSGEPLGRVELTATPVAAGDLLGGSEDAGAILEALVARALAGLCAMEVGVADRALRMTADYATKREQFGKPIGSFQAVGQRAADAFIDLEAIRLTTWQAIYKLANGDPALKAARIAKFWAAEGGHRVVYAAQHLHGGIGMDMDYPLQRSYVWSKRIELELGSAHAQLARLGAVLAA